MVKAIMLTIITSLLSGCAVVFQGPRGKACVPSFGHVCKSLLDTDR